MRDSITNFVDKSRKTSEEGLKERRLTINKDRKYWMPYMDMDDETRKALGLILFLLTALLLVINANIDKIINLMGSTTTPFITFVIPGILYHYHL